MQPVVYEVDKPSEFSLTPLTDNARKVQAAQNAFQQSQMQAQALEEQQRQQTRAIEKQKAFEADFQNVISTKGHDPKALISLSYKYPGMLDESLMKQIDQQEKKALIKTASPIYFAAKNGKYDIASQKAEEAAKAFAQTDPESAQLYMEFAQALKSEDEGIRGMALDQAQLVLMGAMGVEDFSKAHGIRLDEKKFAQEQKESLADIAKTEAETTNLKETQKEIQQRAAKLVAETKKIANENDGKIPMEKRPKLELDYRNQYLKETDEFQSVSSAYDRILASKDDAAGDLALIFNYMKMLDPGSTVREGEFANAQNAGGVEDKIRNTWNKLMTGERLNSTQRTMFKNQAKGLFSAGEAKEKRVRDRIKRTAEKYNLDVKNIFAEDAARVPEPVQVNSEQEASNYIDSLFAQ